MTEDVSATKHPRGTITVVHPACGESIVFFPSAIADVLMAGGFTCPNCGGHAEVEAVARSADDPTNAAMEAPTSVLDEMDFRSDAYVEDVIARLTAARVTHTANGRQFVIAAIPTRLNESWSDVVWALSWALDATNRPIGVPAAQVDPKADDDEPKPIVFYTGVTDPTTIKGEMF